MNSVAPKSLAISEFLQIEIDGDNPFGLGQDQTLNHTQTDATQAKHGCRGAGSHFGGIQNGPEPVVIPQPSKQAFSKGADGLILAKAISWRTVYSENVEVPV